MGLENLECHQCGNIGTVTNSDHNVELSCVHCDYSIEFGDPTTAEKFLIDSDFASGILDDN